jgi:hypothetical protein
LDKYLQRGWIRESKSPAGAPILFAKKKDGTLRLCVDYRGLNAVTIKNRYPLPLIQESLDRLATAVIFSKIDIRDAYHRMRIREGDEWKTAFRTRYGHYEYTVVPFGLTNAPAAFQAYINTALGGLLDVSCIVYLDDILIFSQSEEEHTKHVTEVLERLLEYKLYAKLSKCEFHTRSTEFLGFIVSTNGVSVDEERVRSIQEWPEPASVRDIRIFMGFINYYRRFIHQFSKKAAPLNSLTQKMPGQARGGHAQRKEESVTLDIGPEGRKAFQNLKDSFLSIPILSHYNPSYPTRVETDASGRAISGILSQLVPGRDGKAQWRPIAFHSRRMKPEEGRYDTHNRELLAIVDSLKVWRHYLESTVDPFELYIDYDNLRWFMKTKELSKRQVRWAEKLAEYYFDVVYRPGVLNPADGPSRRPDYIQKD